MGEAFLSEDERHIVEAAMNLAAEEAQFLAANRDVVLEPESIADHMEPPQLDSRSARSTMSTLARVGWFRRAHGNFELDGGAVQDG